MPGTRGRGRGRGGGGSRKAENKVTQITRKEEKAKESTVEANKLQATEQQLQTLRSQLTKEPEVTTEKSADATVDSIPVDPSLAKKRQLVTEDEESLKKVKIETEVLQEQEKDKAIALLHRLNNRIIQYMPLLLVLTGERESSSSREIKPNIPLKDEDYKDVLQLLKGFIVVGSDIKEFLDNNKKQASQPYVRVKLGTENADKTYGKYFQPFNISRKDYDELVILLETGTLDSPVLKTTFLELFKLDPLGGPATADKRWDADRFQNMRNAVVSLLRYDDKEVRKIFTDFSVAKRKKYNRELNKKKQ